MPVRTTILTLAMAITLPGLGFAPARAQQSTAACGPDAPCQTASGSYHLRLPEDADLSIPLPVLVFFHGHRGSGRSIFRGGGIERSFVQRGYAVVAPNGVRIGDRDAYAWAGRDGGSGARDDVAFVGEVLDDMQDRFPVDTNRIYAAGFSAGGSMAWQLACYAGDRFAGYAAVAGSLRNPQPSESCPAGPVRLLQIHGFADNQVPFEGRAIGTWNQGDVFAAMADLRGRNACRRHPDTIETEGNFWCRDWSASCEAGALRFCMHPGGHGLPNGWTDLATEFFEAE